MAQVGQQIRQLREAKGWNQAELAVYAGIGPSGVSQIETGKRNPSAATLQKIAEALGVEISELFPKAEAPLWSDEPIEERRVSHAALTAWFEYLGLMLQRWGELEGAIRSLPSRPDIDERSGKIELQRLLVQAQEFFGSVLRVARTADYRLFRAREFDVDQLETSEREILRLIEARAERLDELSQHFMHHLGQLEQLIEGVLHIEALRVRQVIEEFLESVRTSEVSAEKVP